MRALTASARRPDSYSCATGTSSFLVRAAGCSCNAIELDLEAHRPERSDLVRHAGLDQALGAAGNQERVPKTGLSTR